MPYPQFPWELKGNGIALASLFLIKMDLIRPFIPEKLNIMPVMKGQTLGCVYYGCYGPGSEVEYNEFAFFPAITGFNNLKGLYTYCMYVDNPLATSGVYESSGIRKEIAAFNRDIKSRKITVSQNEKIIAQIQYGREIVFPFTKRIYPPNIGITGNKVLLIKGDWEGRFGVIKTKWGITQQSPLYKFGLNNPLINLCLKHWNARLFYKLQELPLE